MAKWKRTNIGSVVKDKEDENRSYIKIREDVSLKKGEYLNLESKKDQLKSFHEAIASKKLTGDYTDKILERIESIPEWVRFEIIKVERLD